MAAVKKKVIALKVIQSLRKNKKYIHELSDVYKLIKQTIKSRFQKLWVNKLREEYSCQEYIKS
jgi:hypothetical protein